MTSQAILLEVIMSPKITSMLKMTPVCPLIYFLVLQCPQRLKEKEPIFILMMERIFKQEKLRRRIFFKDYYYSEYRKLSISDHSKILMNKTSINLVAIGLTSPGKFKFYNRTNIQLLHISTTFLRSEWMFFERNISCKTT